MTVLEQLVKLANDLCNEGYQGGTSDRMLTAWAKAMFMVANGRQYDDNLVTELLDKDIEFNNVLIEQHWHGGKWHHWARLGEDWGKQVRIPDSNFRVTVYDGSR